MHTKMLALAMGMTLCVTQNFAAELKELMPNPSDIQVVPMDPTPEPDDIELRITFPSKGEIMTMSPVHVEMRLDWYPLGVDSDFTRQNEIFNYPDGQGIHVVIDDKPFFDINEALFDALDDHNEYYDQTAEFDLPFNLSPGMHIIRAFPVRSFGESLKGGKCFISRVFYVKDKSNPIKIDLTDPLLTYNVPDGKYSASQPILLDFYISNCVLSRDGYKVRLTIDGVDQRTLSDWVPYYIYGLKKGSHTIRLELLDPQNAPAGGPYNDVTKTFSLY